MTKKKKKRSKRRYVAMKEPENGWTPERIKKLRRRLGISQNDFAQKIGVTWITVNRWENGKYLPQGLSRRELERIENSES